MKKNDARIWYNLEDWHFFSLSLSIFLTFILRLVSFFFVIFAPENKLLSIYTKRLWCQIS